MLRFIEYNLIHYLRYNIFNIQAQNKNSVFENQSSFLYYIIKQYFHFFNIHFSFDTTLILNCL